MDNTGRSMAIAHRISFWYKQQSRIVGNAILTSMHIESKVMEPAELKAEIGVLSARIGKVRDWL